MEYLIIHNNEPIGRVVEPEADSSMGVIIGPFVPFPAYEHVRSVFRIYAELVDTGQAHGEKLQQYYKKRDVLTRHLSITTITGLPVETLWINIEDFSEYLGDDGYEAHFCVAYADGAFLSNASLWDRKKEEPPR
jgi:hypothetical protein